LFWLPPRALSTPTPPARRQPRHDGAALGHLERRIGRQPPRAPHGHALGALGEQLDHAGVIQEARQPGVEHVGMMLDLLGG